MKKSMWSNGTLIVLLSGTQAVHASIEAIAKGHLLLRVKEAAPWLYLGVISARAQVEGGSSYNLAKIAAISLDGNQVKISGADDQTRAALWMFTLELKLGYSLESATKTVAVSAQKIPSRGIYSEEARLNRLKFISELSSIKMPNLTKCDLAPEKLTGNIENLIGSIEIPVGLAGPLLIRGEHARGIFYAPLATTEGALVASATRGATAITESGGLSARVVSQQMMRVPLFVLSNMRGAFLFHDWLLDHTEKIKYEAEKVSRHAQLVALEPFLLGKMVHVKFLYETGDAAGQNMTTSCTWHACQWIMLQMQHIPSIKFDNFIIEANMSGDKKVNFQSFISGRGTRVLVEGFLDKYTLERVLKVTPEQLIEAHRVFLAGSIQIGMIGFNINVANIIAAMFAATGQDIACVHESSLAQLSLHQVKDGIHASMLLPSLIIGTVGGGTHLPKQNECLQLLDCAGPHKAGRLAEIIAGFCLALDLSTLSAIASGQFAHAHEKLGRNRPVNWFSKNDLNREFFDKTLQQHSSEQNIEVQASLAVKSESVGSSIITELTARKVTKCVGLFPFDLECRINGVPRMVPVMVKVKPLDEEVSLMINSMASMCGPRLASSYAKFQKQTGFIGCHVRELALYQQKDQRFTNNVPRVHGIYQSEDREAYILILERLQNMVLMDSAEDVSGWNAMHIEAAISGAAQFHAIWYGREKELNSQFSLGHVQNAKNMGDMSELWEALCVHAHEEFPEWIGLRDLNVHRKIIKQIPSWWGALEQMPQTLIHNDFNPRNICFRNGSESKLTLCAYDWELATMHVPQHDIAELLCFVLSPSASQDEIRHYVELHRHELERASDTTIDAKEWRQGFRFCLADLAINRFGMYLMAHTFRHYGFMKRSFFTLRNMMSLELGL